MKKSNIIIQIVLFSILAMFLVSLLGGLIAGRAFFNIPGIRIFSGSHQYVRGTEMIQKDEFSTDGVSRIELDMTLQQINIKPSPNDNIYIEQYSNSSKDNSYITYHDSDGTIRVQGNEGIHQSLWFNIARHYDQQQTIDLYLPDSYTKKLDIHVTTGTVDIERPLKLEELSLNCSAGTFDSDQVIECDTIQANISAGTIRFDQLHTKKYDISASTGEIDVEKLYGGGKMEVTLGKIDVGIYEILDTAQIDGSLGEINIRVSRDLAFNFVGTKTLGDVQTDFPCTIDGNNFTAQVGMLQEGELTRKELQANITVGSIDIRFD